MSYGNKLKGKSVRYTPDSALRKPWALFQNMISDLILSRELAWQLFLRNISAAYRQTFFGYIWAFIPPLAMAFGFSIASGSKVINISNTELPYVAYIVTSMVLWQTFAESLNGPTSAVEKSAMMLARVNFPREALVLATVWETLFNLALKMVLIVGIFFWYGIHPSLGLLYAPIGIMAIILLGTTIGILIAPIAILYKDVTKALPFVLLFSMFVTPVVFPLPKEGLFAQIVYWNPITPLLVTTRDWLTGSETHLLPEFIWVSLITLGFFLVAWLLLRLAMPYAIERLGS